MAEPWDSLTGAIVKVGDGRGFLIGNQSPWPHRVITAAHCLPHLPPAHRGSFTEDRTYANLLGPLQGSEGRGGPRDGRRRMAGGKPHEMHSQLLMWRLSGERSFNKRGCA